MDLLIRYYLIKNKERKCHNRVHGLVCETRDIQKEPIALFLASIRLDMILLS